MKNILLLIAFFSIQYTYAQNEAYVQEKFCKNLNKVFEDGRQENFESITGMNEKQSPFLQVPGYSIKLEPFGTIYVDKDSRFVGRTEENLDSLTALKRMDEIKQIISPCLDSTWRWSVKQGDDSATVFFKEIKELRALTRDLNMQIAMVTIIPNKIYSVNLYVRRNKQRK